MLLSIWLKITVQLEKPSITTSKPNSVVAQYLLQFPLPTQPPTATTGFVRPCQITVSMDAHRHIMLELVVPVSFLSNFCN